MFKYEYTEEDLKTARHLLMRYGFFKKVVENQEQEYYWHLDGHEVRFELTNRYPFDIRWNGTDWWELEFSLDGLLVELQEGFDRLEEE